MTFDTFVQNDEKIWPGPQKYNEKDKHKHNEVHLENRKIGIFDNFEDILSTSMAVTSSATLSTSMISTTISLAQLP